MRRILIFFIIFLCLFLLSELLLPPFFSHLLQESLRESLDGVEVLRIQLKTSPAILLLLGRVQELYLKGENVMIQGLTIHTWEGHYSQILLPPVWQWGGGDWTIEGRNHFLTVVVNEDDLNVYLADSFQDVLQMEVSLLEEGVFLSTSMELYNMALHVKMAGQFQVEEGQYIVFVPEDLTVENFQLPQIMMDYLMEELDFYLDLKQIPLPVHVTEIETRTGQVFFLGGEGE